MLDVDGSGSVEIDEFSEQLATFGTIDQPFINIRLMKQLELARKEIKQNREYNVEKFFKFDSKLNTLGEEMKEIKALLSDLGRAAGIQTLGNQVGEVVDVGEKPGSSQPPLCEQRGEEEAKLMLAKFELVAAEPHSPTAPAC
jgi:hypothetical protein